MTDTENQALLEDWAAKVSQKIKEVHGTQTSVFYSPSTASQQGEFMVTLPSDVAKQWEAKIADKAVTIAPADDTWRVSKSAYLNYLIREKGVSVHDNAKNSEYIFANIPADATPAQLFNDDFAQGVTIQKNSIITVPQNLMDNALKILPVPQPKADTVVPPMPRIFTASKAVVSSAAAKPPLEKLKDAVKKSLGDGNATITTSMDEDSKTPTLVIELKGLSKIDYERLYRERFEGKDRQVVINALLAGPKQMDFKTLIKTYVKNDDLAKKYKAIPEKDARDRVYATLVQQELPDKINELVHMYASKISLADQNGITNASINERLNGANGNNIEFTSAILSDVQQWEISASTLKAHMIHRNTAVQGGRMMDNKTWLKSFAGSEFNPSNPGRVSFEELAGQSWLVKGVDGKLSPTSFFNEKGDSVKSYPMVRVTIPIKRETMQAFGLPVDNIGLSAAS